MNSFIMPTSDQFKEIMSQKYKGPIYMINLLKFKPDGGARLYERYGESGRKVFDRIGLQVVFRTRSPILTVIGGESWDEVLVARYPSISAFIEMNRDPEYREAVKYRTEALLDSRLYMVKAEDTDISFPPAL